MFSPAVQEQLFAFFNVANANLVAKQELMETLTLYLEERALEHILTLCSKEQGKTFLKLLASDEKKAAMYIQTIPHLTQLLEKLLLEDLESLRKE